MKRFLFLAVIAMGAMVFAFIAGCSDDETPTGGGTGGDTTVAEFSFASQELSDEGLRGIDMTLTLSFDLLDSIPSGGKGRAVERNFSLQQDTTGGDVTLLNLTYTYGYSSGWHVFTFDAIALEPDSTDTIDVSGVDSIQITSGGIPQIVVPMTSDGLKIRNHFSMTTRVMHDTLSSSHSLDFTGDVLSQIGTVTINGTGSDSVVTTYSDGVTDCDLSITNNLTINNVVMDNGSDDCPTSGTLVNIATVALACQGSGMDSLNVDGAWTVTWTFSGTSEHISFNDGTTTWSVTRECGGGNMNNPTDTTFVSDMLEDGALVDVVFRSVDLSIALLDSVPAGVSRKPGENYALQGNGEPLFVILSPGVYTYNPTTNWHIFNGFQVLVIDTFFNDTTTVNGTDSVKIFINGTPVQNVSVLDSLDGISTRAHVTWANNSGGENGAMDHSVDVTAVFPGVDTIVTINATTHDSISVNDIGMGMSTGCSSSISLDQTITGLQMNVTSASNDCPMAGSLVATANIDAFCIRQTQFGEDTLQFNGSVAISALVNMDQSVTFNYDDGTTVWSTTQPCIPSGVARYSGWSLKE